MENQPDNQSQSDISRTKLPPMTLSVVVPAIPASFKNANATHATHLTAGAMILFSAAGICFLLVPDAEMRSLMLIGCVVGLFATTMLAIWQMKKLMSERDDYERRLQETTFKLVEKNSNLKQLVQIDPLTQLLNRRGLERALSVEMSRAKRSKLRMFAVLLDCDDFKAVNENNGHAGGDAVLSNMAMNIFRSIRPTDYASRIGGDEFIVFLIDVNEEEATIVAERIRENIEQIPALYNGKAVPCTASLGVAELPPEIESIEEVLTLTRQSLKASKNAGKNAITVTGLQKLK